MADSRDDRNNEKREDAAVKGDVSTELEDDTRCGWFSCRPRWLQAANIPNVLLLLLCWLVVVQGMFRTHVHPEVAHIWTFNGSIL